MWAVAKAYMPNLEFTVYQVSLLCFSCGATPNPVCLWFNSLRGRQLLGTTKKNGVPIEGRHFNFGDKNSLLCSNQQGENLNTGGNSSPVLSMDSSTETFSRKNLNCILFQPARSHTTSRYDAVLSYAAFTSSFIGQLQLYWPSRNNGPILETKKKSALGGWIGCNGNLVFK